MATYNSTEVDRFSTDICPYNENHRLHSLQQFQSHILKCKDQNFPGVKKLRCKYNCMHVFVDEEKLAYHLPRCEGHPMRVEWMKTLENVRFGETPRKPTYETCPYFPYHAILVSNEPGETRQSLETHINCCPRRNKPLMPEVKQTNTSESLIPLAPIGSMQMRSVALDADLKKRLDSERLILHYREIPVSVHVTFLSTMKFPEKNLYMESMISAQSPQFPGLQLHTEKRDHADLLIGKILPDPSDAESNKNFWALYGGFEQSPVYKIGVSYQHTSSTDVVWLIVHPREPSGFGGHVNRGELGLFKLSHSEMRKIPSTLEILERRTMVLANMLENERTKGIRKDEEIAELAKRENEKMMEWMSKEETLKQELANSAEALAIQKRVSLESIEAIKLATIADFDAQAQTYQTQLRQLKSASEQLQRELEQTRTRLDSTEKESQAHLTKLELFQRQHESITSEMKSQLTELEKRYQKEREKATGLNVQVTDLTATSFKREDQNLTLRLENEELKKSLQQAEAKGKKRTRDGGNISLCRECGEYPQNTSLQPCGHMYYCNLCLDRCKLPVNKNLSFMTSQDKFCPICKEEIRKIVLSHQYKA